MNDVLVIGGNIVGLDTASKLSQRDARVLLVEKEGAVAEHQLAATPASSTRESTTVPAH